MSLQNQDFQVKQSDSGDKLELSFRDNKKFSIEIPLQEGCIVSTIDHEGPFSSGVAIKATKPDGDYILYFSQDDCPFLFIQPFFQNNAKSIRLINKIEPISLKLKYEQNIIDLNNFGCDGLDRANKGRISYLFQVIVEPSTREGIVVGWLSQERGSGIIETSESLEITPFLEYGRMQIDAGKEVKGEILVFGCFDDCLEGLEKYAGLIGEYYKVDLNSIPKGGYCTWYALPYGRASDENVIQEMLDYCESELVELGFEVFQIDDGWQSGSIRPFTFSGPKSDFTKHDPDGPYKSGMKALAGRINDHGMIPGIWLLPFAWDPGSSTMESHHDWYVKKEDGEIYYVRWAGWCLDMSNPGAKNHLKETITRITEDWGYRYLKLDGLWSGMAVSQLYPESIYAPDNIGDAIFHDPAKTNVEVYRDGLKAIREAASEDTYILGCNVAQNMRTLGASMGLLDGMRIGRDVGARWEQILPCAEMGTRLYFLHNRVWHNDPDCLMLREPLTLDEARAWGSWIVISGQLNIVSEWLAWLPEERTDIFKRTIPNIGLCGRPVDLFQRKLASIWVLKDPRDENPGIILGVFNWEGTEEEREVSLLDCGLEAKDDQPLVAFEFWSNKMLAPFTGGLKINVKKHACKILSIKPVLERPQVISTSRHLLQGIVDLLEEKWESDTLFGKSKVVANDPYEIRIHCPGWNLESFTLVGLKDDSNITHRSIKEGDLVRITVESPRSLTISWQARFNQ
ncbi:MAG: glycoside hydrolase family 36 protein [Candidatus Hodarchaeota archaeon]